MRRQNRQAHEAQLELMFEEPRPSGANLSGVVFRSESGWRPFSTTAISKPAYRRGARQDAGREYGNVRDEGHHATRPSQ
jgi:hypothetical protein